MSHADVFKAVSEVLPCAHMAWDEGAAPALPWAVYYLERRDGDYADGRTYTPVYRWVVELYQRKVDRELENAVEAAIEDNFGPASVTESWVDAEHCTMTVYRFTQIGDTNG